MPLLDAIDKLQASTTLPKSSTYPVVLLQKIDALPRYVTDELVVLVKVPPVHLLRLLSVGTLNLQKSGQARSQGGSEGGQCSCKTML